MIEYLILKSQTPVCVSILFILVKPSGIMDQVPMAVHAAFFIAWPCVKHRSVGKHGPPFVRNIEDISMAFLTLLVLEGGISLLAIFFVIIFFLEKMYNNILDAMCGLGIEKIKGVVRSRQMAVHAVCHKSLGIIYVG